VGRPRRTPARDRQPDGADRDVEVRHPGQEAPRQRRAPRRIAHFPFVQFEFGFLLGPHDGRYLRRAGPDAEPERVVVLRTLGAPQRRLLGRRRPKAVDAGEVEPVPTARATIVEAKPYDSREDADAWLDAAGSEPEPVVAAAARELNIVLRSHRAAAADPYARDVRADHALVVRLGYGEGEQVADGRFGRAVELSKEPPRRKRGEALAPQERLAAILGGRDTLLIGEELLLRARLDLDAGRSREAALQARVALEALLAELEDRFGAPLRPLRAQVGSAANAALDGDLSEEDAAAVEDAVSQMTAAARRNAAAGAA
jgi:hypothetical protein